MAFAIHKSVKSGNVDNLARTMWAWSLIDDRVEVPVSDSALSRMNAEVADLTDAERQRQVDETLAAMKGRFAVYLDETYGDIDFGTAMNVASQTLISTGVFGANAVMMVRIEEEVGMSPLGCDAEHVAVIVEELQERLTVAEDKIEVE